ncbi:subtilisin-like protein [Rhizina undulata]
MSMQANIQQSQQEEFDTGHICSIVPPFLLENLAKSSEVSGDVRQSALDTLEQTTRLMQSHRTLLANQQPSTRSHGPAEQAHTYKGYVYSRGDQQIIAGTEDANLIHPGTPHQAPCERIIHRITHNDNNRNLLENSMTKVSDEDVKACKNNVGIILNFYKEIFHMNSIDNKGMTLICSFHYGTKVMNGFWDGYQMIFGDGNEQLLCDFTKSLAIAGHELTHGVIQHTAALACENESGALNESIADAFGSMIKQWHLNQTADEADWLIGEDCFSPGFVDVALRSLKAPGTAFDDSRFGKDCQPNSMAHYQHLPLNDDHGGVHTNSGIPNHAFYLVAINLGGHSWKIPGTIWFKSLTHKKMTKNCNFKQFADIICELAQELYGVDIHNVVKEAWKTVGVLQ